MAEEIAKNIFFIPGRRKGGYPFCNSIFIQDRLSAIIDPASNRAELALHQDAKLAILSHFHNDHIRDLKLFPDAQIAIHEKEALALSDRNAVVELIFFPEEPQAEKDSWMARKAREMKGAWGWKVSRTFQDGDELNLGEIKLKVIHTPGHTIGHCCFWFPDQEILFSADIDLTGFGPWYGNACSSAEDFYCSLEKLRAYQPKLVVTGHELGLVQGEDFLSKLNRYQGLILVREQKILDSLASPKSLEEIVDLGVIYGEFLKQSPSLRPPERRMVIHHMRWLDKKGLVGFDAGKWISIKP